MDNLRHNQMILDKYCDGNTLLLKDSDDDEVKCQICGDYVTSHEYNYNRHMCKECWDRTFDE